MVKEISEEIFKQDMLEDQTVLFFIWSPSCTKCKKIIPQIEEMAQNYAPEIRFVKLNADKNNTVLRTYKVPIIPAVIIFSHGLLVERRIGIRATQILSKKIAVLKSLTFDEAKMCELKNVTVSKLRRVV